MVFLRHSFCWALKWTHQVVCLHSKDLVHGTAALQLVSLARSVPSHIVGSVCVRARVLYFHCAAIKSVCLHLLNCVSNKFACRKNSS